jgi:uncharacterized protein Usg
MISFDKILQVYIWQGMGNPIKFPTLGAARQFVWTKYRIELLIYLN